MRKQLCLAAPVVCRTLLPQSHAYKKSTAYAKSGCRMQTLPHKTNASRQASYVGHFSMQSCLCSTKRSPPPASETASPRARFNRCVQCPAAAYETRLLLTNTGMQPAAEAGTFQCFSYTERCTSTLCKAPVSSSRLLTSIWLFILSDRSCATYYSPSLTWSHVQNHLP